MLKFELNLAEANLILSSLAKQPYEIVVELINKLREQAQPQLDHVEGEAPLAE
jgi:hypothetical protein